MVTSMMTRRDDQERSVRETRDLHVGQSSNKVKFNHHLQGTEQLMSQERRNVDESF